MQVAARSSFVLIWLLASILATLSCSLTYPAAHSGDEGGDEYIPVGNDAFYHARRILDTAHDPGAFYEFDPKIHAPEGSLLVWPWGYDYAMSMAVRGGLALGISSNPMEILTWLPVAAVFISIGLLVLIARRLELPLWLTALAALCMALAPTTQLLHGPGEVDHHFAELILLLAALAVGLRWLQSPASRPHAALLGILLGLAPAVHNALFILQLPLLLTALAFWLQRQRLPRPAVLVFCLALMATTVAVLLPSSSFRAGRFEFYTLSWFHLYVAGCSTASMLLMSQLARSAKTTAALLLALAVMSVPLFTQLHVASTFVSGANAYLESIDEMRSPLVATMKLGYMSIARVYSFLIFLAPLTFILCLVHCWRDRATPRLLFWVTASLGLALLASQQRMHYFGGFALYLPWLILAADFSSRLPQLRNKIALAATACTLLLYLPVLRHQLIDPMPLANDPYFEGVRPLYGALQTACARDPGIVLADSNAGHPIRFYTDCSVIANNFMLTPQHFSKLDEADHLFSLSAAELARQPRIKYLLIRALAMRQLADGSVQYKLFFSRTSGLARELLFSPAASLPPEYTLLQEVSFAGQVPYARLFRIDAPKPATE